MHYAVARAMARRTATDRLSDTGVRRLLVVCYGNIYRSPFVERCLRTFSIAMDLEVRSAGFHRREGRQVEADFEEIAREGFGVDLSDHRSRLLTTDDLDWAHLVLIMDGHNYRLMHDLHRDHLDKCLWLGAISPETPVTITDPYGTDLEQQRRIAGQLHVASRALIQQLNPMAIAR
ncbi:MAG: low molecular weight phosphatase family protein [Thiohalobacteraceae bacterium]